MSYASEKAKRDAEPTEARSQWCAAQGCPNQWTVDAGHGRLCSAHAYAPPHQWPAITQQLLEDETDRARANSARYAAATPPMSREQKVAKLRELQLLFRDKHDAPAKAWAYALKDREARGEPITQAQRQMWRAALGPTRAPHPEQPEVSDGPR